MKAVINEFSASIAAVIVFAVAVFLSSEFD